MKFELLFSGYGHANFKFIETNKPWGDFLLIHLKDSASAARVMKNKHNLILNGCKFYVSEAKVTICNDYFRFKATANHNLKFYYFSHLKRQIDQKAKLGIEPIFRFYSALTTLFYTFCIDHA